MISCPKIHPEAHAHLEQLTRFWVFNRKTLATTLAEKITALSEQARALFDAHTALQQQAATLGRDKDALGEELKHWQEQYAELNQCKGQELASRQQALQAQSLLLAQANLSIVDLLQQTATLEHDKAALSQKLALCSEQAQTLGDELKHWQEQYAELKQRFGEQLTASQQELYAQSLLLAQANLSVTDLEQQTTNLEHGKTALSQELALCSEQARTLGDELAASKQEMQIQSDLLDELREQSNLTITKLQQQTTTLEHDKTALSQELALCSEQALKVGDELASSQRTQQAQRNLITWLEQTNADLRGDYKEINQAHLTYQERFSLVRNMLALPLPHNTGLDAFSALIDQDFRSFASDISSLDDEAGALLDLQNVYEELKRTVAFPAIKDKVFLAIAGGFSSGKSAFINSFIQDNSLKLATGINPVTVVPSYVVCAPKIEIRAYNTQGSSLELEIEKYKDISHELIDAIGFDLRRIMPSISVKVPMDSELFEHICLIDTPGYNPGSGASAESMDSATALNFVRQCSAMIWVIGLDTAGTIAMSDIKFIQDSHKLGTALYIVINKADTKPKDHIKDIIEQIVEDLELHEIEYAGICAYSSVKRQTYTHHGDNLHDFIKTHNRASDKYIQLKSKIDDVFVRFMKAIGNDISKSKEIEKMLNTIGLSCLQHAGSEVYREIKPTVKSTSYALAELFNTPKLEKKIIESQRLSQKFKDCILQELDHLARP